MEVGGEVSMGGVQGGGVDAGVAGGGQGGERGVGRGGAWDRVVAVLVAALQYLVVTVVASAFSGCGCGWVCLEGWAKDGCAPEIASSSES